MSDEETKEEEQEEESRFTAENRKKKALVTVGGNAVTLGGKLTKSNYFRWIGHDLDEYDMTAYTPEQAKRINMHLRKLSTGSTAMVPIFCGGPICPFANRCPLQEMEKAPVGKQCHPRGTIIYTTEGYKAIESLDSTQDKIVTYANSCGLFRKRGRNFKVATRLYTNKMIHIQAGNNSYDCTKDHICVATWNRSARNLFAVYLMQKEDFWRVGKVSLIRKTGDKLYSGLTSRANQEQCDKIWILGLYETNTEALLAEEYFSVTCQIPKACFINRPCYAKAKQDGLYKWVTQEQLDMHHCNMLKPICHYAGLLEYYGLSIHYPFWDKKVDYRQLGSIGKTFKIRACNLFSKYMDVLIFDPEHFQSSKGQKETKNRAKLESIEIEKYDYDGVVYSLDVEQEHTYIAGNIVTHNCLIEVQLLKEHILRYFEEFDVDPSNYTEVGYINELAEIAIMEMRLNMALARPENAELVIDQVVQVGQNGAPILQKQLSPFMEQKEKLSTRKSKIIKLMVGDRQEKYKKEAALKVKLDFDPSSKMAKMRSTLESLSREMDNLTTEIPSGGEKQDDGHLSPEDLINASLDEK